MSGIVWLPPASADQAQAELDELLGRVEYLRRVLREGPREIVPVSPLPSGIDWDLVEQVIGLRIKRSGRPDGVNASGECDDVVHAGPFVDPDRDVVLNEKVDESAGRGDAHRGTAGPFSFGEPSEDRLGVVVRVDLEGLGAVVQRCHGGSPVDSSGGGTPGAEGGSSDSSIVASDGDSGPGPFSYPAAGPLPPAKLAPSWDFARHVSSLPDGSTIYRTVLVDADRPGVPDLSIEERVARLEAQVQPAALSDSVAAYRSALEFGDGFDDAVQDRAVLQGRPGRGDGRPESALSITVEVPGRGGGDSCPRALRIDVRAVAS